MSEYQIIEKPWGREEVVEINDKYMVKKLTMWAGHRCSLQFHNIKKETIYVLSGVLKIIQGTSQDALEDKLYRAGDTITTVLEGDVFRFEKAPPGVKKPDDKEKGKKSEKASATSP